MPALCFASTTYGRIPAGLNLENPITIDFSFDDYEIDLHPGGGPLYQYWRLIVCLDGGTCPPGNPEFLSQTHASSTKSTSEVFTLPVGNYNAVVIEFCDEVDCAGGDYLEGDESEIIFTVSESSVKAITGFSISGQEMAIIEDNFNWMETDNLNGNNSWSGHGSFARESIFVREGDHSVKWTGLDYTGKISRGGNNSTLGHTWVSMMRTTSSAGASSFYVGTGEYGGTIIVSLDALGEITALGENIQTYQPNVWYDILIEWTYSRAKVTVGSNTTGWHNRTPGVMNTNTLAMDANQGVDNISYWDYINANPSEGEAATTSIATINEADKTIALNMPFETDVTGLTPTINITGASISPATSTPTDFTSPVIYTVTALDNSTTTYTVTVTVALNPAKAITAFGFASPAATGVINGTDIAVAVPYLTDVTALVPTITITGASVSPATSTPTDFTSPVIYTVTALDNSTTTYTVTVTVALNPAPAPIVGGGTSYSSTKAITAFSVFGQTGATIIDENAKTIDLTVPYGTDVAALAPTITITGSSVSPASGAVHGFATSQTYTVTADNGSTKNYIVTVNVALAVSTTSQETDWFIKEIKRTDIFRDGKIDVLDFNALMVYWGTSGTDNPADTNQDGLVDFLDFNALMIYWGEVESRS